MAPKKGMAPPPPKAKAKPASKWSRPEKIKRTDSGEIVKEWRKDGRPCCIDTLDWSSLESFSYIGGGSGGVILTRFTGEPPKLCCLKPQRLDGVPELYAAFLAQALGIPVAQLNVIRISDEVVNALKKVKPPIEEHTIHLEKKVLDGTQFLAAVEFVNGPMMEGIEFVNILKSKSAQEVQKLWEEVGRLLAFDCLINNYDRLPLIWDNAGNPKNVMLDVDPTGIDVEVKGIDQAVRPITSQDGLKSYCQKLRSLVQVVNSGDAQLWNDGPFKRLHSAIQTEFCGMLDVDSLHLRSGLRSAFESFARSWTSGQLQDQLVACQTRVAEVFRDAGSSNVGLDKLEYILTLVRSTASIVAEECQASQLQIVPEAVVSHFQKIFPGGNLVHQQLQNIWHMLDPECSSDEIGAVFDEYFKEKYGGVEQTQPIDWTNFLVWLYTDV